MQEVSNAIVDIGSYDDESETLIYHTEKLAEAEPAITQVRNNLYAPRLSRRTPKRTAPEPTHFGRTGRLNGRAIRCVQPDADRSKAALSAMSLLGQDDVDQQSTAALTSR